MSYCDETLYSQAVQYVEQHIGEDICVQQMARQLCVSASTLYRVFRRCAGMGAHRFIRRQKMEMAMSLLKSGRSVRETAEFLGYSTSGYFAICFKQEMGVNPSEAVREG